MVERWPVTTWGSVSDLKYGRPLKGYRADTGSTRVFGTNGPVGWTSEGPQDVGPRPIVGRKGAYRGVHLAQGPFWVIDTAYWLEPGPDLDPLWAYYKLLTVDINGMDSGSAIPSLTRDHFRALPLRLPSLDEQRRVASVLSALDEAIAANTRVAEACDRLRQALVADELDAASATVRLSKIARFVNGRNFTRNADGVGKPVIRTPEVRNGPSPTTVRSSVETTNTHIAEAGDVLFVWSGSLCVGRWRWEPGLVNQHVFKVVPHHGVPSWLIHALIERQLPWFLSLAADKATTMGHIQRSHLDAHVPLPSPDAMQRLETTVLRLWNESLGALQLADRLASIRDELLPLLLSGLLSVREAEELIK